MAIANDNISNLLADYTLKLNQVVSSCKEATGRKVSNKNTKHKYNQMVLELLLNRDKIALILPRKNLASDEIEQVIKADQKLKTHAPMIVQCVGSDAFRGWKDAGLVPAADVQAVSWWWRLNEEVRESLAVSFLKQAGRVMLWLTIAVSLSYIVEVTRRFLGSGADAASVVTQGFLALLVGGTLVQFARQLVEGTSSKTTASPLFSFRSLSIFASILVILLVIIYVTQPSIAAYYSNLGVRQRMANNHAEAIQYLRRATDLNPSDAIAHYNLGVAYQKTKEYDSAEAEYRAAIKWNPSQYMAYSELSRLIILRRNDFTEALRLADDGLNRLKSRDSNDGLTVTGVSRMKYALLVMRAWAYLGLQLYRQAENTLNTAIAEAGAAKDPSTNRALITGAEALCLKGKLFDAESKSLQSEKKSKEAADKNKQALCSFSACRDKIDDNSSVEPDLFGLMQERLSVGEMPDCEKKSL